MFAAILALGMVEKSSRMANVLCMERDWVPTVANANDEGYSLTHMNTTMRRIDIACKILAPLAISYVVVLVRTVPAALAIAVVTSVTLVLETWSAMRVWNTNSRLRAPRGETKSTSASTVRQPESPTVPDDVQRSAKHEDATPPARIIIRDHIRDHVQGLRYYFTSTVWVPSICMAILHGSVLAWSGTLITWLLNAKFTLNEVTIAKGVGSLSEIGSTVVFPFAVTWFTMPDSAASASTSYQMVERQTDDDDTNAPQTPVSPEKANGEDAQDSELIGSRSLHVGVVKVAHGALTSLLLFLIPTIVMLFYLNSRLKNEDSDPADDATTSPAATYSVFAIMFFTFLSFSFLGRWTYDLAVTQLTQMLIPATHRSSFGGVEQAIVSCVSLVHWVAAAIWHQQADFVWLALGSICAIAVATGAFTWWARWWTRIAVVHAD